MLKMTMSCPCSEAVMGSDDWQGHWYFARLRHQGGQGGFEELILACHTSDKYLNPLKFLL